jgi:hypothetical protein
MKTHNPFRTPHSALRTWLFCLLFVAHGLPGFAQGTAFTYQGRLDSGGTPYTGSAEFQATLWNAASAGSQIAASSPAQVVVSVSNGLFVLPLDFGANFPSADRWLQLEVRTTIGDFTLLAPRQQLTATPYAVTAVNVSGPVPTAQLSGTVPSANLGGTYSGALTLNNAANSFSGSGAGLTALNASQLTSGTVPDARLAANVARTNQVWLHGGNAGTTSGTDFIGTTDAQALEFKVNGLRAVRIEPAFNLAYGGNGYSPNIVSGSPANVASNGIVGAVIGGGGSTGSGVNRVGADFATVVGGRGNSASGVFSTAMGLSSTATNIGSTAMGGLTTASGYYSTAMGVSTTASGHYSTAMGGETTASGEYSTALGYQTTASGNRSVAMGEGSTATGYASVAMGRFANAIHSGSFVWADSELSSFASTLANQFSVRASGGMRLNDFTSMFFGTRSRQMLNLFGTAYGIGVQDFTTYFRSAEHFAWHKGGVHNNNVYNPGAGGSRLMLLNSGGLEVNGTFVSSSDRNAKENFAAVNAREMLEKVASLPLSSWNYKADPGTRHVGPMAQDFHAAFNVGPDDKRIATVDADGVALAAIQGLNEKVESGKQKTESLEQRLAQKETEITELKQELSEIKQLLVNLSRNEN